MEDEESESTSSRISVREPSDLYKKSKRYIVANAGILLLITFVGIERGTAVLGVKIRQPEFLGVIFSVVVFYYFVQLNLFWAAQAEIVRQRIQYRLDYVFSLAIAVAAVCLFVVFDPLTYCWPLWLRGTVCVAVLIAAIGSQPASRKFLTSIRKKETKARTDISLVLQENQWVLIYNPARYDPKIASTSGSKPISFAADGSIGVGNNSNESRWRIQDRVLEILNSDSKVFSRFSYDEPAQTFRHTNDPDTLSLRDQIIILKSEYEKNLTKA